MTGGYCNNCIQGHHGKFLGISTGTNCYHGNILATNSILLIAHCVTSYIKVIMFASTRVLTGTIFTKQMFRCIRNGM